MRHGYSSGPARRDEGPARPDPAHGRPGLGDRLPRRDDRERRAGDDRARPAVHRLRAPRGPDLRLERVPCGARRAPDPRRRPLRQTGPQACLPPGPARVRDHLRDLRGGPEHGGADPRPAPPGRGRCAPRAGRPLDHHRELRWRGARARDRCLGRGDLGARHAGPAAGRLPRAGGLVAGRLPGQPAARADRPGRAAGGPGVAQRGRHRAAGLARRDRRRRRGGRARVRRDTRTGAGMAGPACVRRPRGRRGRARRLPGPHGGPAAPARAPGPVPVAQLLGREPVHARDLRGPLREPHVPEPLPPGHAWLHAPRVRHDRDSVQRAADAPLDACRTPGRAVWRAAVHGRRPAPHGDGPLLALADPLDEHRLGGHAGLCGQPRSPGRLPRGRPARRRSSSASGSRCLSRP